VSTKIQQAFDLINQKNAEDPNIEVSEGNQYPKELLYAERMSITLLKTFPNSSEELKIATKAQHICRWKITRKSYPMDKVGYFNWRNDLKKMHAKITSEILEEVGYDETFRKRVSFLIRKKALKKDAETQTLEDVICLVFLQYYMDAFCEKHSEEKIIDILQKTWGKMSEYGQESALKLSLSEKSLQLVKQALS
jgi:predicted nuclease of restriction endonuclease-like (RecB) superfamily